MRRCTGWVYSLLVLLFFVFAPAHADAQSRIQGQVFGLNRRPVADVYVELLNEVESVIQRMKTDGAGLYAFLINSPGRYYVRVRPFNTNYEEQTAEVEINTFVGGRQVPDNQQRDFYLKERRSGKAPAAAPGVVFVQEVPPDAQRAYDRAAADLEDKRIELAIEQLRNAVSIFPAYFDALYLLGTELLKQQKFEEAAGFLERAVAVNERSSASWYGLAFCYYALDRADKAVDSARRSITYGNETTENLLILGISLRKTRDFGEAEKALQKAKKLSKGRSADASWHLALLYAHNLKDYRAAADELENYLKIRPDHPDAQLLKKLIKQYRTQPPQN
jgi:tetratricopeptide (TPR) repeat protein